MATINTSNFGIVEGRLAKDPVIFENSDGSKKVKLTVCARDSFRGRDGQVATQFVELDGFIPATSNGLGVYAYTTKGRRVSVAYGVRTNNYTDKKTGATVYTQVLQINGVQLVDPPAHASAGAAEATSVDEDVPFAAPATA